MFNIDISPLVWGLGGGALLSAVSYYIMEPARWREMRRRESEQADEYVEDASDTAERPLVSIVAHSGAGCEVIGEFLESLTRQTYSNIEVIIVIEGTERQASELRALYNNKYPWAEFSFVPPESRNLSHRKLANTMGIKRAQGDIIVTTLTNISSPDPEWIARIARHFEQPHIQMVLGYASMDFSGCHGVSSLYRCFDSLMTASRWINFAFRGKAYRGDGANLAFRRDLFFSNNGYGKNFFLHPGDDDIYVSQVATSSNTAVELASQSHIVTQWGAATTRMWIDRKEQYDFTRHWLSISPRIYGFFSNLANWLTLGLAIAASVMALPNLIPLCYALALLASVWGIQWIGYDKLATAYNVRRAYILTPLFLLLRPIITILFRIRYRSRHANNYTWRR